MPVGPVEKPLTLQALRSQARTAFARGEAYWQEGRVLEFKREGEIFEATVIGSRRYRVRAQVYDGRLVAACTCPVEDAVCKHAVALALEELRRRERAAEQARDAAAEARVARAAEADQARSPAVFRTTAEVEQWAGQHEIGYFLDVSADRLLSELSQQPNALAVWRHFRYALTNLPLREIVALETARRHLATYAAEFAACGRLLLEQEAQRVAEAIAQEAARPGVAPATAGSELATLWRLLVLARRSLRSHASPRPRAWRSQQTWSLEKSRGTILWKETELLVSAKRGAERTEAQLSISDPGTATAAVRLRCRCLSTGDRSERGLPDEQARCVHALALLDSTLDVLENATQRALGDEAAQELARELLKPPWSRALEELGPPAEEAKPRATIELWWQLERELGELTLTPVVKKFTKTGALTAGARLSVARLLEEHGAALEPRDQLIAEHLVAWAGGSTYPIRAFASAVGHPRLLSEVDRTTPVTLVRLPLGFTALPANGQIRLEPALEGARFEPRLLEALLTSFRPGEPLLTADPAAPGPDGPDGPDGADGARFLMIDVSDEARRLWTVLARHGSTFPPESHAQLLEKLAPFEARLPLSIPRELKGRQINADERVVIRLRLLPDVSLELELFVRPGAGAPLYAPNSGPRDVMLLRDGERVYVRRELLGEPERARAALEALPLAEEEREEGPPGCFRIATPQAALRVVAALDPPPPGVEAEWISERPQMGGALHVKQLRVVVDHQRDWFGIAGDLKVEQGRLELAVLLDAARRQHRFVQVGANRWMELTDQLRDQLRELSDRTFIGKQRMELSPGAVPAIRALIEAGAAVEQAPAWQQLGDRLAAAGKLKPRPPAGLQTILRDYQVEGHAWLSRLAAWGAGACLADDMGLGKTVQTIALLLDRSKLGPALVLAPTSVCWNWVEELARFAPSLRPILYVDQENRAEALAKLGKRDVLIASYGLLVRDADKLAATSFATLVIDEAQALKNPTTQRARAARTLDAGFRVALSGTPMENHVGELWSLFSVVFPGLLGSWEQFRDRYASSIERTRDPEAHAALGRVIRPFLLRRTKQEVARELPERTEIQLPIALSHEERQLYEDARLAAVAELSETGKDVRDQQHRFQVLAALTRLRLLASHPRLYDPTSKIPSSKLRRLVELLEELRAEGHRALVYSQFTSHLGLVQAELGRAGIRALYLDGSTPAAQRKTRIKAFQEGEGDVFLISLKAGGTGVNLTAADYVIHLDPWWNPAVEDQATARAHRIGQTRPVTVYRLIARGTIEEKILALHGEKRALVASILDGTDVAGRLSTGELMALLASGPLGNEEDGEPPTSTQERPMTKSKRKQMQGKPELPHDPEQPQAPELHEELDPLEGEQPELRESPGERPRLTLVP
jgi:superfamily II DNA or RNA helicase